MCECVRFGARGDISMRRKIRRVCTATTIICRVISQTRRILQHIATFILTVRVGGCGFPNRRRSAAFRHRIRPADHRRSLARNFSFRSRAAASADSKSAREVALQKQVKASLRKPTFKQAGTTKRTPKIHAGNRGLVRLGTTEPH